MVLLSPVVMTLPGIVAAEAQCSLSGKTVRYIVTICSDRGCQTGRERLQFIGDNVLYFNNPNEPKGDVYYLGRTVDLGADEQNQTRKWTRSPDPRLEFRAFATASFDGTELKLHVEQTQHVRGNSTPAGRFVQSISLRISECSTCTVQAINMAVRGPGLTRDYYMRESSSCQVTGG